MGLSETEPNPDSVELMAQIDELPAEVREMIYEFGFAIVAALINQGVNDPDRMDELLHNWRERRQAQWLATNYITPKTIQSIVNAAIYRERT